MTEESSQSIQKRLQESESRLRSIFQAAPVGIGVVVDRVIKDANDRLCEMTGYSRDELLGQNTRILYLSDADYNYVGSEKYRQIAEKGTGSVDIRWRRKDGKIIDVLLSSTPLNPADFSAGVTFTALDITERKQAVEKLQKSEEKYRILVENAGEAIFVAQEGMLRFANDKAAEIIGYSKEELTSIPFTEFIHPEDRNMVLARHIERQQVKKLPSRYSFRIVNRSGDTRWVDLNVVLIEWEGKHATLNFLLDITEGKRTYEELLLEKERFHTLIHNAPFGMMVIDENGNFTYANPKFTEIFGYDLNDVPNGKRWFELAYPDSEYRKQVVSAWIEDLKSYGLGEKRPRIFEVVCKDGSRKIIHFIPVCLETGENLIACEDITERIKLEDQLRQAQKMESVGLLAGGVAHDFNNMLQAIIGYAELAMMKSRQGASPDADLIQISQAAQRSADLTRQLLAFARKQMMSPTVLDLNKTVASMIGILNRIIGEDIELVWKPGFNPWPVKMDPAQIDQILANLLVNARDAIAGVGKVTIETENAVLDESYCRVNPGFVPGEYALLSISDTGSGMDKETVSHIFEPFFTTKEIGKGTGLGLAMVYGIIKQNSGFINVHSEPGHGTTFKIYLPRCQDQVQADDLVKEEIIPGGTETVLVVEDEKMLLEFVGTILEEQGYKVLSAEIPADALTMAREYKNPIHLLITDVVMPEMNGREVKEAVTLLHPDIKAIYMSGYTADVIALKGIIDEGAAFLQKPFTINSLALKVREVLDG